MEPDDRAVREVHAAWINAVNADDLARLLPLMADDAVFLNQANRRSARRTSPPTSRPPTSRFGSGAAASWRRS